MWVLIAFDLPIETRNQKRAYRQFREFLLSDGFIMLQYSVYARPCPTSENSELHMKRIENKMPDEGEVRLLSLTAMQYAKMRCFYGKKEGNPEQPPDQLSFF